MLIEDTDILPILLCVHDFHSEFKWNNQEMQPHLATLRFEEGLMLCKLHCLSITSNYRLQKMGKVKFMKV